MFKHLGIVGTGTIGSGIAQLAALSKIEVSLYDVNETILRRSLEFIKANLRKSANTGALSQEDLAAAVSRLHTRTNLPDLGHCDFIIESVIEDIRIKQDLFKRLDANTKSTTILASTTSSLSITSISTYSKNPERIVGLNFLSPITTIKLTEVIKGYRTNNETIEGAIALINSLGKTPVVVKDTPGFITTRVSHIFYSEAVRLLGENIADAEQLDKIIKIIGGFSVGPLETMDNAGIDNILSVMQSLYNQSYSEPRLRPHRILKQMAESGTIGKKSGKGFFIYDTI